MYVNVRYILITFLCTINTTISAETMTRELKTEELQWCWLATAALSTTG